MISSNENKWVKLIRRIRNGQERNVWLIEGHRTTRECLDAGLKPIAILVCPELSEQGDLDSVVQLSKISIIPISKTLLSSLTDQDSPRGVIALFERKKFELETGDNRAGLYIFADRIQDPRNLGTLIRVSMAFDASGIFLGPGSCSATNPRAIRASSGLIARAPIAENVSFEIAVDRLRTLNPSVIALDPRGDTLLDRFRFTSTLLLIIGTEGRGLSAEVKQMATTTLAIPMKCGVESLNLATATAVACYEFMRQTRISRF